MKANRALREGEPDYNLAEELISAISHGLGALFGVAALVLGLLAAADDGAAAVVGAVLYGIGAKKRYFHSIFHFFVLAGSILHFLCIYLCVL